MRTRSQCLVLFLPLLLTSRHAAAAEVNGSEEPPKLLGRCSVAQLEEPPFDEWFHSGYKDYEPNPEVLRTLRGADRRGVTLTLFFGTWCGDSKREVPRMLKLLDEAGLPRDSIELVAVDSADGQAKRSPGGEERGLEIYRVPTLIVRRGGTEIARIVEFPVLSLERDLLAILTGMPYEPNYRSYPVIRRWLIAGLLGDENVSAWGLANEVRGLVATEGELAAAAHVLLDRGDVHEGVKLTQVRCALYQESARCYARLAEGQLLAGDAEAAREAAEQALRLNTSPDRVGDLLDAARALQRESGVNVPGEGRGARGLRLGEPTGGSGTSSYPLG